MRGLVALVPLLLADASIAVAAPPTTLRLDAPAEDVAALRPQCFLSAHCGIDAATADYTVGHADLMANELTELVDPDNGGAVYYSAGAIGYSTANMSAERTRKRRDRVDVSRGTLADGAPGFVVRLRFSSQDFVVGRGQVEVSSRPWTPHAWITVCASGPSARCSRPFDVDCSRRACTATLRKGDLAVRSDRGLAHFQIAP
jgi:hypothetical protein